MDFRGQTCLLYPHSWQGAVVRSTTVDIYGLPDTIEAALTTEPSKAGLLVSRQDSNTPAAGLVVRWEIVRADPGNRLNRWDYPGLAGAAVVEVEGQIGDASATFGHFYAKGTRRTGFFGGGSQSLLTGAARLAGRRAAKQIVACLKAL